MGTFLPELQGVMETKNKHEIWELRQMQALPLEAKVTMTKHRIQSWVDEFGIDGVYVSFSGGKDSTVLLHIARQLYPNMKAVFVDVPTQFPELKEFVLTFDNVDILKPKISFAQVCEKYGFPMISKEVSNCVDGARKYLKYLDRKKNKQQNLNRQTVPNACYMADLRVIDRRIDKRNVDYQNLQKGIIPCGSKYRLNRLNGTLTDGNGSKSRFNHERYKFFLDADFEISDRCCDAMKKKPVRDYERRTGRRPIIATMAVESAIRTQKWLQDGCNAFAAIRPHSNPMSFWTEQDVLIYIKEKNLPICSVYGEIVTDYEAMGQCENQMTFSDYGIFGEERQLLKTTGCARTGCVLCGFGCHLEKENRFLRLKETHPKFHNLLYVLKNNGVTYAEAIDWINENGNMNIRY